MILNTSFALWYFCIGSFYIHGCCSVGILRVLSKLAPRTGLALVSCCILIRRTVTAKPKFEETRIRAKGFFFCTCTQNSIHRDSLADIERKR